MNGAQYLVEALAREGVGTIFGYPGGAIMPVYDALVDADICHILVRHEQGAAFAADGYARVTGKVGVCLATSGPGATNLVTGLANAMLDSVPMVAITGQVGTTLIGTDAFQEVDVLGITMPVVKHSYLPRTVDELVEAVPLAFEVAREGRPGPVLIDLPKDIALAPVERSFHPQLIARHADPIDQRWVAGFSRLLAEAKQPVIYGGGGIALGDAVAEFRRFVERSQIPVVTTLKGIGALPTSHPANLGMLGMHGGEAANHAVQASDLLIVLGARFDDRATGKLDSFAPRAGVIHIDIDAAELGKLRRPTLALRAPLAHALAALVADATFPNPRVFEAWRAECSASKARHAWRYDAPGDAVYGPRFLRDLSAAAAARGVHPILCCDVGQHQMWVAQHCAFESPRDHLTSAGLGAMGYGLPAAIGAQLAAPERTVIVVSGDGSIMMNVQELATALRYRLPIKIVVFDNHCLGMVRQWQELFFDERLSEVELDDNPDFAGVARAFGIPSLRVERRAEVAGAIARILSDPGPLLVHVLLDKQTNVWPLVPPGCSNAEMMTEANR